MGLSFHYISLTIHDCPSIAINSTDISRLLTNIYGEWGALTNPPLTEPTFPALPRSGADLVERRDLAEASARVLDEGGLPLGGQRLYIPPSARKPNVTVTLRTEFG